MRKRCSLSLAVRLGRRIIIQPGITVAIAIGLAGCGSEPTRMLAPAAKAADGTPILAASLPSFWASEVSGQSESGAFYSLLLPKNWNGRVVVVIHGWMDPLNRVAPLARTPAEDTAGAHGYAIAYSSFSENGWAVKDGAQSTHELTELFTEAYGTPSRVYLYGQSMGGLIAIDLAESFPTQYDGVISECGAIGGPFVRFRYMLDTRLLFDYFYPHVLPGGPLDVQPGAGVAQQARLAARAAMAADKLAGAKKIAQIAQAPIPYTNDTELEASIEDQVVRQVREINEIVARGHGELPVDRSTYTSTSLDPSLLAQMNASLPHFTPGKYAMHYWEKYYEPNGDLQIPVLSLYTDRDPALPAVLSDTVYSQRLIAAGNRSMFRRQAASVSYGHCTGKLADRIGALRALVTWAEGETAPW